MPGGGGTGPMGTGPMSGRGAGFCAGFGGPGYSDPAPGDGFEMGFGRGRGFRDHRLRGSRGWRHRHYATGLPGRMRAGFQQAPDQHPDPKTENQALRSEAEALGWALGLLVLQGALGLLKKRLGKE
jgi:hypothetical protein